MKTIQGIENLKDEFRKAKIIHGDFRGLKNKFALTERFEIDPMQTFFFAAGGARGRFGEDIGKVEIIGYISENDDDFGFCEYTMKDFVKEVKKYTCPLYITFEVLKWNKGGTDRNSNYLETFQYIAK